MRANNLTLLTDLYELTMMQGYFKNPTNQTVIFDMFYRTNPCGGAFAITAGLEQMIEYIENLKFTDEDIEYLRSLNTFEEDFLEYLSNFRFTGDIWSASCPVTGCRYLWRTCRSHRWMCRYFLCSHRQNVRRTGPWNSRTQLDHELPG